MCQLKSVLILKDKVFCPDYDSHDEMLRELGIKDTRKNAERLFVRAEITPDNLDLRLPVAAWKYKVDQDIIPEWYVAEVDEARARKAVEEWAKVHVLTEGHHDYGAGCYYLYDSASATLCGSASATLCGSASAKLYDSASATLYDSASAKLYGSASGIIPTYSSNNGKNIVLNDAAVLVNHRDGIIKAWGKEIKR